MRHLPPDDLPLFPPSRKGAPSTSAEAARAVAPCAATLRARVLSYIEDQGERGATDQEIQNALGLESNTQGPRRWELAKMGLVVASGRKRPTRSGCNAMVWVARRFGPLEGGGE